MHKDENGYIVVETIGTFIPFVLLVVSILSLVNIVTLQSRVHYALTQAANTLSMYSYGLEVTGVANDLDILDKKASVVTKGVEEIKLDIDGVLEGIESLSSGDVKVHGEAAINRVSGWGQSAIDNPKEALQLVLNYGLSKGNKVLLEELLHILVSRYLINGDITGDQYLKSVNVVDGINGLKFFSWDVLNTGVDSTLIDKDGNVKLVASYEVEYKFGSLPLPFTPKLKITQTVKTKAWLNGSGKGYW